MKIIKLYGGYIAGALMLAAAMAVTVLGTSVLDARQGSVPDVIIETRAVLSEADIISGRININTAGKEELMTLEGIGEKTALAIIEYRENAPFESIDDLTNVSGIGSKKLDAIRDMICV